jgi:hypothetical protein
VTEFVDHAGRIFDAAESALRSGNSLSDVTILIGSSGGIHIIADSDWPLEALATEHGARMAFRVTPREATVRVEGRSGGRTCVLETARPDRVARQLLGSCSLHTVKLAADLF